MWYNEGTFYQIYPLGYVGAPRENDGVLVSRIKRITDFADYYSELGITGVLFNPIFESSSHGYDVKDYLNIDKRLGTNEDFKELSNKLHKKGIRIILDAVFNHVGRDFLAFQDVLKNREASRYKDWFFISFDGNSNYNDGLYYEGWEGHYELVKLNLNNPEVSNYLIEAVKMWIREFDIDGLRLDVAYLLEGGFMALLRQEVFSLKSDFFLVGEVLFGDYNRIVNDGMLNSCTNYECYKGIYSSLNSYNMFEISYSLNRQFGKEDWCIYRGKHLMSFVDNHDVSRFSSILTNKNHIPLGYVLLFTMPGIPCIYYGSEWGIIGEKADGDNALRPEITENTKNELSDLIKKLIGIRKNESTLCYGGYENIEVTNRQLLFTRSYNNDTIFVAINIDENPYNFRNGLPYELRVEAYSYLVFRVSDGNIKEVLF